MSVRRRAFLVSVAALFAAAANGQARAQADVTDRALRFALNLYTGVLMKGHEWLVPEVLESDAFKARGGLAAMGRQSTSYAREYGGVSSIQIGSLQIAGDVHRIDVLVAFKDDARRRASPAIAEREDIIWRLAARKLRGRWLFAFE